jgi:hypothetical protein
MFDAASKLELKEMLGYERFVLDDCIRRVGRIHGKDDAQKLIINDDVTCIIEITLSDCISDSAILAVYEQLAGLLFSTAYKVIDMIFEWTLRQNGETKPVLNFTEKVDRVTRPSIIFPDFLLTDIQLNEVLQQCYKRFLPYRNAMTHGKWGEINSGTLNFDFTDRTGLRHTMKFTSIQLMAWVDTASQIASMLLVPATVTVKSMKAVKRKLNILQPHHGGTFFVSPGLRSFQVVRRTEAVIPFMVDMQNVRLRVEQQALGKPYEIELRIESGNEGNRDCWEIPPENVPIGDFLLDSTFDRFKVNP